MPDSFLNVLDAEIADLEREMESNPTYLKLCEAKRLRALYGGGNASNLAQPKLFTSTDDAPQQPSRKRGPSPNRQAIVDGAVEIMRHRGGHPTKTADILAQLSATGVEVPGQNPKNNLSAMLSNSDLFVSHGRAGWTLAEDESAADENSGNGTSAAVTSDRWADYPAEPPAQGREAGPGGGT